MKGLLRAVLVTVGFLVKVGILLAVAGGIGAFAIWHTVDASFKASEVVVPDVRNLTLDDATQKLADAGLGIAIEARRPHESLEPGLVSYQDPVPGASTRRQRVVRVTLSAGQQLSTVPDLVGKSRREAAIALKSEHVALGQVVQVAAIVAADIVLAQSPSPGAPLEDGGRVDLLVSSGPRHRAFVMPDVTRHPAEAARELVTMAGLRIAQERVQFEPGAAPGTVLAQEPPPGTRVFRDAAVVLTVSRGPEPPGSVPATFNRLQPPSPAPAPGGRGPQPVTP